MRGKAAFVYVLALGVTIMMGCGGDGGGDDVPRSSAAYAGSSLPAVLDTTSGTQSMGGGSPAGYHVPGQSDRWGRYGTPGYNLIQYQ